MPCIAHTSASNNSCQGELVNSDLCEKDVSNHLKKISQYKAKEIENEWVLILARLGIFAISTDKACPDVICEHHRYQLGVGYRPKTTCQHPLHQSKSQSQVDRTVSYTMSKEIFHYWNKLVPIGSGKLDLFKQSLPHL